MKARLENGIINTFEIIPRTPKIIKEFKQFTYNGVTYGKIIHGLNQLPELWELYGYYDLIIPSYSADTQYLGSLYWDEINKIFSYRIVDIIFPTLEEIQANYKLEVSEIIQEVSIIVSAVKNIYDPLRTGEVSFPSDFIILVNSLNLMRTQAYLEIDSFTTIEEANNYVVRGEGIVNYISQLKSFL